MYSPQKENSQKLNVVNVFFVGPAGGRRWGTVIGREESSLLFFFLFFQKKVLSSDSTGPPGERTERNCPEKRDWMEVGMKREKSIYAEMKH